MTIFLQTSRMNFLDGLGLLFSAAFVYTGVFGTLQDKIDFRLAMELRGFDHTEHDLCREGERGSSTSCACLTLKILYRDQFESAPSGVPDMHRGTQTYLGLIGQWSISNMTLGLRSSLPAICDYYPDLAIADL
jgi:hypothetical protein